MAKTMRVFVTGATGWIGTAVVKELRTAGHSVLGMAHSDAGAAKLTALGVDVYRADIREPAALVQGVRSTDATIHLAFHMDFSDFAGINKIDREAITAMLSVKKPLIGTNGTLIVAHPGKVSVETDDVPVASPLAVRHEAEKLVTAAGGTVIRLAPTVHGAGDHGFVAMLVKLARDKGVAGYLGDGQQHWPAVHRDDAAVLYRLALEQAPGGVLHGTAEQGISQRAIAEAIGEGLGVSVRSVAPDHFGWMAAVVGLDNRASNDLTRARLGWLPEGVGLLDDIRANYCGNLA
ncbi:MAG: SDR family oxidoreductase [Kofleriaceae bacterium]